jgi:hypothetical protein
VRRVRVRWVDAHRVRVQVRRVRVRWVRRTL